MSHFQFPEHSKGSVTMRLRPTLDMRSPRERHRYERALECRQTGGWLARYDVLLPTQAELRERLVRKFGQLASGAALANAAEVGGLHIERAGGGIQAAVLSDQPFDGVGEVVHSEGNIA